MSAIGKAVKTIAPFAAVAAPVIAPGLFGAAAAAGTGAAAGGGLAGVTFSAAPATAAVGTGILADTFSAVPLLTSGAAGLAGQTFTRPLLEKATSAFTSLPSPGTGRASTGLDFPAVGRYQAPAPRPVNTTQPDESAFGQAGRRVTSTAPGGGALGLGSLVEWAKKNPEAAKVIAETVSGAASSYAEGDRFDRLLKERQYQFRHPYQGAFYGR